MKLELTPAQYRSLVKQVFLGNWVANATKFEADQDQEAEEVEQLVFSLSRELRDFDLVQYDSKFQEYFPTRKLEEEVEAIISDYDDYVFWEELSSRLAQRDTLRKLGPVRVKTEEHLNEQIEIEEKYRIEFSKNGLKNLILKQTNENE